MTAPDTTTTEEPTIDTQQSSAPPADPAPEAAQPDSDPPAADEPTANSEAARWRTKLRDAEAQRDTLAEKVATYQRREAERVVADILAAPADLWDVGRADVSEFLDDDGELTEHEIRAAAAALIDMRPGLAKPGTGEPRQWGQSGQRPPSSSAGWASVISGR